MFVWCVFAGEEFAPPRYGWLGSQSECQLTLPVLDVLALTHASCELWDGCSGRCGGAPKQPKKPSDPIMWVGGRDGVGAWALPTCFQFKVLALVTGGSTGLVLVNTH